VISLYEYISLLQPEDVQGCKSFWLKEICSEVGLDCVIGLVRLANVKRGQGKGNWDSAVDIYIPKQFQVNHDLSVFCGASCMERLCSLYAGLFIRIYSARSALCRCRNRCIRECYLNKRFSKSKSEIINELAGDFGLSSTQIKIILRDVSDA